MVASSRWRNLGAAAGAATAALFAIFDLYQWALAYAGDRFHNDFTFYFAAAKIGLTHGWGLIYGLQLGQPGLFVALGVAGSYALLKANRPLWAGVALGALALKPQLGFLVPLALLAAREYRAFLGSVIALGVLGVASVLALGA